MKVQIENYLKEIETFSPQNIQDIENFKLNFLSKKGIIQQLFSELPKINDINQRKEIGTLLNELKNKALKKIEDSKLLFEKKDLKIHSNEDLTKSADFFPLGSHHPISIVKNKIIDIFSYLGFSVAEGPEIEDDWHNFTSLNFPPDHPARDMQDTFFIEQNPDISLRTHTSSVQIRLMEKVSPPIRAIMPGRVFRNEAISARAHCIFHQIEGLYVDKNVSFADLKQTLYYFAKELFGINTNIRFRPSFFPFTEPSAEMDISCFICNGKGCNICKNTGWVEILGCGMVDPNVLENCNIDSKEYTGFAFGMGIERITMLKYQIKDLRLFFENDLRFLLQFQSVI
ncbi:MAG TPA: phenylalanine--tRNA ligase subunit alpha [Bacteroidales bacterium]|nr:phenylalanine--tRNA ligase subunit alpha [Bacteroidales bacterium]